jgi:transcriptional regulator with XRE-family HTH domain
MMANYGEDAPHRESSPLQTGEQLHRWRVERGLTAKRLAELIEVTERSIHRAERGGRLGARIKLGMRLLEARIASGEITLSGEKQVVVRGRPRKERSLVVREEPHIRYGKPWHGELRSGADIRTWRKSVGLYVQELSSLLDVDITSLVRAEQSDSPSSRIVYGVELLRAKVLSGEVDIKAIKASRPRRGRPKKT